MYLVYVDKISMPVKCLNDTLVTKMTKTADILKWGFEKQSTQLEMLTPRVVANAIDLEMRWKFPCVKQEQHELRKIDFSNWY